MIILGIDPGTTRAGFGVVRCSPSLKLLDCGLLKVSSDIGHIRLRELHEEMQRLIKKWKPEAVALEKLFFAKNAKTALEVSEARGAILLTTALARLPVYEYTPLEVKKIITGDGRADKKQLEKMVRLTLIETKELKAHDDVFDAIAIALACHFNERLNKTKKVETFNTY
jgi:crossover junction endodeoxyribonuclease RuvC